MQIYSPKKIVKPNNVLEVPSAWVGLESILEDILDTFNVRREKALEFGVEYGYSTVALSNYFRQVIGVDTFKGDQHTEDKNIEGLYEAVKSVMPANVKLYESSYQDYIKTKYLNSPYDLIHIDIAHTYEDTFNCGDWSVRNAKVVLFHDTQSFPDVMRAVEDLATKHNLEFHNYPFHHGLGILCKLQ